MNKKNVVIISRTILPLQAPRSLRATELAKEFARQGHKVTLYAVLGRYDYSSFEKRHNLKIKNIGKMSFATLNSDGEVQSSLLNKLLSKILKKLIEFPDIELIFKTYKILKKELNIDLLITVAIPFPLHWGASLYRSKYKLSGTWVADCGDPYMGNEFHKPLWYFKYIEKWFCRKADYISVPIEGARKGYYSEFQNKIRVIPQGYNFDNVIIDTNEPENSIPTFIYSGALYAGIRDPKLFLEYLMKLEKDFKFIVYTKNKILFDPYIELLGDKLVLNDYIPRESLLLLMSKVDFLVNFENGTTLQSPSKLIDYAIVQRPILSLNSSSINETIIDEFLSGNYNSQFRIENIEQYHIQNVALNFLNLVSDGLN